MKVTLKGIHMPAYSMELELTGRELGMLGDFCNHSHAIASDFCQKYSTKYTTEEIGSLLKAIWYAERHRAGRIHE